MACFAYPYRKDSGKLFLPLIISQNEKQRTIRNKRTKQQEKSFTIAGIGASAGGLPALIKFFDNCLPKSGLVYLVVMHLSPEHKSILRIFRSDAVQKQTPAFTRVHYL